MTEDQWKVVILFHDFGRSTPGEAHAPVSKRKILTEYGILGIPSEELAKCLAEIVIAHDPPDTWSPSFLNAQTACLASRRAGAKIHWTWPEYRAARGETHSLISGFASSLAVALEETRRLSETTTDEMAVTLRNYASSLHRRSQAFRFLVARDHQALWGVLSLRGDAVPCS